MSQAIGAETSFRLLVLDEAGKLHALLSEPLVGQGYDIACALTEKAARAFLDDEAQTLGALVIDIERGNAPVAAVVARHARRLNPLAPVIFVSDVPAEVQGDLRAPGAAFVVKPFDPGLLVMILEELAAGA
ncbi:hypothetical protein [Phenylobacterium sp.]|uniref:hypothetical protein n=1 Tax=Phenylobacterium sp. TaxID=1871053 RepID=UPI002FCA37E0